jgi:hypothetical protein
MRALKLGFLLAMLVGSNAALAPGKPAAQVSSAAVGASQAAPALGVAAAIAAGIVAIGAIASD